MIRIWVGLCALWLASSVGAATARAQPAADVPVAALQRGGHVLLFRHGDVVRTPEEFPLALEDCAAQRGLTERGREDARNIGAAFGALSIPVSRVLASPFCRTVETAHLAFGRVEVADALLHPRYLPVPGAPVPPDPQQRLETVKQLLASPPPPGSNTALITHGEVIMSVLGVDLAAGEAAIFRPDGRGGTTLVVRVLPDRWPGQRPLAQVPGALPRTGESSLVPIKSALAGAVILLTGLTLRRRAG